MRLVATRIIRAGAALLAAASLVTSSAAGAGAWSGPDATHRPAATSTSHRESLEHYHCTKWTRVTIYHQTFDVRTCVNITRTKRVFAIDYEDDVTNHFKHQSIPYTCRHSETTQVGYEVSAEAKAEAGLLFEKVELTLTGTYQHQVETTEESETSFKVRPRHSAYCQRGVVTTHLKGLVVGQTRDIHTHRITSNKPKHYTAVVPSHTHYNFGPGLLKS